MNGTLAVDFDGVLYNLDRQQQLDEFPGGPLPGAIEWLNWAVAEFTVVIFTARGHHPSAAQGVRDWLQRNGYEGPELEVTHLKPPALAYLDDRAIHFTGRYPTAEEVLAVHGGAQ